MADIFISYKSERRPAARHLANVLTAFGYSVWYDYGLIPGSDFAARIEAEVRSAKVVITLWCSLSVESQWVRSEANLAKAMGKLLPCQIEACRLPIEFSYLHTLDLGSWSGSPRDRTLDRLIDQIGRVVGREPSTDLGRLRELEQQWRDYGAPALASFPIGSAVDLFRKAAEQGVPTNIARSAPVSSIGERPPSGSTPREQPRRPEDPFDVFISYKHERRPAADHLRAVLSHYGYTSWIDYARLRPGEGYAHRLESAVRSASAVLVLWCGGSIGSDWVRKEAGWAKDRGSYLPVWLEDVPLPVEFSEDHTLPLQGWCGAPMDAALAPMLHAIGELVGRRPQSDFYGLWQEHQTWERYGRRTLVQFIAS